MDKLTQDVQFVVTSITMPKTPDMPGILCARESLLGLNITIKVSPRDLTNRPLLRAKLVDEWKKRIQSKTNPVEQGEIL